MVKPGTFPFWKCEQNLVSSVQFLSLLYYVFKFLSFYLGSQCNILRDHPGNSLIVLEFSSLFLLSYLFMLMADVEFTNQIVVSKYMYSALPFFKYISKIIS